MKTPNITMPIRPVACVAVFSVTSVTIAAWAAGNSLLIAPVIALGFAVMGILAATRDHPLTKPILGIALMGQCIALTAAFAGHPWQIDSHMAFFAALAVLMALRDIKTILAATAVVAVHHLTLSLALPALVYPDGSGVANLGRTAFHAVIVLMEAAVLILAIHGQNTLIATQSKLAEENASNLAEAQLSADRLQRSKDAEQRRFAAQAQAIETLSDGLHALSNGRLDVHLTQTLSDEYEPLRERFNLAVTQMERMVATIIVQAEQMEDVVSAIQSGTQDLSARTQEQSATLMETALSLDNLVISVDQTATHAHEANSYVEQTRQTAAASSEVLARTVDAMTRIKGSSDHISENLSVIDDIAFQTNLLALNAGVEAARAGEAGKGFAVVASEVRALAQRATEASEEIGRLIAASRTQVNEGVDLMGQTEATLTQMTDRFVTVADLMGKIGGSTQEQTGRLHDINRSVAELDTVTQQNAAMAEETFASTLKLMEETKRLDEAAHNFSCAEGTDAAVPMASAS